MSYITYVATAGFNHGRTLVQKHHTENLYRNPLGGKAFRTTWDMAPVKKITQKGIPLRINWRKRQEEMYEIGAVWAMRVVNDRHSFNGYASLINFVGVISQIEGDRISMRRIDAGYILDTLHSRVYEREVLEKLAVANPRTNIRPCDKHHLKLYAPLEETCDTHIAAYLGHLPDFLNDEIQYGGEIEMEHENTAAIPEYIRGPRVEVAVHRLDASDINPAETTVEELKGLTLHFYEQIEQKWGINLHAMESGNADHEKCAKVVAALLKEGYLNTTRIRTFDNQTSCYNVFTSGIDEGEPRPLFIHKNTDNPKLVNYYNGWDHLAKGRISTAKPGKLLKRLLESYSDEHIKQVTNDVAIEILPTEFELLTDPREIVKAYLKGPSSCTSKPQREYQKLRNLGLDEIDYHPVAVYGGDSDTGLMVMKKGDNIVARTIVNTVNDTYIRIYHRENTKADTEMREYLEENGYSSNPHGLVGATLRRIEYDRDGETFVIQPYIDHNGKHAICAGDHLVVHGDNFFDKLTERAKAAMDQEGATEYRLFRAEYNHGGIYTEIDTGRLRVTKCQHCGSYHDGRVRRTLTSELQIEERCSLCVENPVERYVFGTYNEGTDGQMLYMSSELANTLPLVSGPCINALWDIERFNMGETVHILPDDFTRLIDDFSTIEHNGHHVLTGECAIPINGDELVPINDLLCVQGHDDQVYYINGRTISSYDARTLSEITELSNFINENTEAAA